MLPLLDEVADMIKEGVEKGGILVHCMAGVSRSATCVIAYLMREHKHSLRSALELVRSKRPIVCPNYGFHKQLKEY